SGNLRQPAPTQVCPKPAPWPGSNESTQEMKREGAAEGSQPPTGIPPPSPPPRTTEGPPHPRARKPRMAETRCITEPGSRVAGRKEGRRPHRTRVDATLVVANSSGPEETPMPRSPTAQRPPARGTLLLASGLAFLLACSCSKGGADAKRSATTAA